MATPVVALLALASVPLATHAGEWLQDRVGRGPLVQRHAQLGDALLPWAAGLVVAADVWALDRVAARRPVAVGAGGPQPAPDSRSALTGTPARVVIAVFAFVVAVGSVVQVYRIGESGSMPAWHDRAQSATSGVDRD